MRPKVLDTANPYAHLMRLRRELYRRGLLKRYHPGIPVISVGNLAMGGTGKSPMTLLVARYLESKHQKKVAIVSRGYGRTSKGYVLVRDGSDVLVRVDDSGDEAQMLAQELPNAIVIVDEDRVHGARQAKNLGAQVIVMDDGYQHLRLSRDLNILLVDAVRGAVPVVPAGLGRESRSAAKDADVLVFTNATGDESPAKLAAPFARYLQPEVPIALAHSVAVSLTEMHSGETIQLKALNDVTVMALSSIARPERFQQLLRQEGMHVIPFVMRDHASYTDSVIAELSHALSSSSAKAVVTTEKDAVKLRGAINSGALGLPVYVLKHELEFLSGSQGFYAAIDRIV